MKELLMKLKKPSRLIYIIGSLLYALLFATFTVGQGIVEAQFMPIFTNAIIAIIGLVAIGSIPLLMLIKKEEAAKTIFIVLASYWLISQTFARVGYISDVIGKIDLADIVGSTFTFISGLMLLGVISLIVLTTIFSKKQGLRKAAFWVVVAFLSLNMLTGIVVLIEKGIVDEQWPSVLITIVDSFIAPIVIVFGYIYFFYKVEETQE